MFEKVAIIGEREFVFAFRALGFTVFTPGSWEEAREALKTVLRGNYALCFLHQSFLEPLREEREAMSRKLCPVVVGFRDFREVTDELENIVRDTAMKATGSDSLVRRKE